MKTLMHIVAITISIASFELQAANYCGDLRNAFGPFDYNNAAYVENLQVVEAYHFTSDVEKLVGGVSGSLGGDLDYTLRAFPNHSRALTALAKLALRDKTARVPGAKWSVECYFDRAIRFKPNDAAVRTLYGSYLFKLGRVSDAKDQLGEAINLDPENGTANYNLGLIHFQGKDYNKAAVFAKKADELGFPMSSLKNKLMEMGKWGTAQAK